MFRTFWKDCRANYLIITAITMVPIMGALALGVDYTELSRQRQATMNALDAAGIATARRIAEGADDSEVVSYAHDFFEANLGPVDPDNTTLSIVLPKNNEGGGTLKMAANLTYQPYFWPVFKALRNEDSGALATDIKIDASTEIRLKNTLEVALVLDNSGSMGDRGSGSYKKRIDILKEAAKQLVDTIASEGQQLKQIAKAVQFGVVPFAASVNVGPENASASWMDTEGRSPIHHENFDWSTMPNSLKVQEVDNVYRKTGSGWSNDEKNEAVTRFTLYDALRRVTGSHKEQDGTKEERHCSYYYHSWHCETEEVPVYKTVYEYGSYSAWQGCVEMRPYPYGVNDAPPGTANPATLFVPMFGPDEADGSHGKGDWWPDDTGGNNGYRQSFMYKYFQPANTDDSFAGKDEGPNASCTTEPITPLTDVTKPAGLETIKGAIDGMEPLGGTSVPDGLAWGWRAVSSGAPFTEGRPEAEHGNDKVVIVLTDGQNTYYTPGSLGYNDPANNKSIYSDYGYARNRDGDSRILAGTGNDVRKGDYSNDNYTEAMNDHMKQICENAKSDDVIVMTVALDLDENDRGEKKQIRDLKDCASYSRYRRDPDDPTKPAKLFWNATGANLDEKFEEIADELSNLRIVG